MISGGQTERHDAHKGHGDDSRERERPFEKDVRQCERVVLVQDGQRERYRRVMADQFDGPWIMAGMQLRQVHGRDGKGGERGNPYRPPVAALTTCH